MEQYIDKNTLENILRGLWKKDDGKNSEHRICYNKALQDVQCEIDSLEVKEVDLEKEIDNYLDENFYISETWGIFSEKTENEINRSDLEDIAKYFFEFGMVASNKAQKGE